MEVGSPPRYTGNPFDIPPFARADPVRDHPSDVGVSHLPSLRPDQITSRAFQMPEPLAVFRPHHCGT